MSVNAVHKKETNPRGIPEAVFIADVEPFIGGPEAPVEPVLKSLQEAIAKYKYMESNLTQRRKALEDKIPDMKTTLNMVLFLQDRRGRRDRTKDADENTDQDSDSEGPLKTTFELNDTVYAEAELEDTDTVSLWLGANVMLTYSLEEAIKLLSSKLTAAQDTLDNVLSDLEFLREQTTVMEVNTARVYNWDVKRRRLRREAEVAKNPRSTEDK